MKTIAKSLLNLPIICCCLVVLALLTGDAYGLMTMELGGRWPENWPEDLEPLRFKASTGEFVSASCATYYYIPFDTRDEFERAWPALLRLKSKGAPLNLCTVDPPKTDPNDTRVLHSDPEVAVVCPTSGAYHKMPDGSYAHHAEWTGDIRPFLTDGILPEYVGRTSREDPDARWVIVNPDEPNSVRRYVPYELARVELTVYADGSVIDLNRIRLPDNTPIRDYRKLKIDLRDANSPPLPYTFTITQRRTMHLPGFDRKILITIDDITAGQVMTTISAKNGQTIVATRSLRPKDVVTFSADGRLHRLKLNKLTNYLLGDDVAQFQLWRVAEEGQTRLSENAKIEKLIVALQQLSGARFVRNDREHSADEAVAHLREKWESNKSEIATAEDFIRIAGSRSSVTGKPYTIRLSDGTEVKSEDWFAGKLSEIEKPPQKGTTAENQ